MSHESSSIEKAESTRKRPEYRESNEIEVPQGSLVFLVGAPGAGKSTFARNFFPNEAIVSTDGLRQLLSNNPGNQLVSDQAFNLAEQLAQSRLQHGKTVVIDAMNLGVDTRHRFSQFAREVGAPVVAVHLDVPPEELLRRDAGRMKRVGDSYLKHRIESAKKELVHLTSDTDIDTIYHCDQKAVESAQVHLSQEDAEALGADLEFAHDTSVAEVNLLEYASAHMERNDRSAEVPRVTVAAGSINYIAKSEGTRTFLENNVLPSQVIDLDWIARRLGTTIEDDAVYHFAKTVLSARTRLNLTTFVTATGADVVVKRIQGDFAALNTIDQAKYEDLHVRHLEIDRNEEDDTPLLVLGDIHGCVTAMRAHERNVFHENADLDTDQQKRKLLFVGDIADRGPYGAEAVTFATALVRQREAVWVKGNHDVNLETGLAHVIREAEQAIAAGEQWEEWARTRTAEDLSGIPSATKQTLLSMLVKEQETGEKTPRLSLRSLKKILETLNAAPTYKAYQHLVAVHASLPLVPKSDMEVPSKDARIHSYGIRDYKQQWTGRAVSSEIRTIAAKDPEVFVTAGHTHSGPYIDHLSGTANLDHDGGGKGTIAGMYWMGPRHGEIVHEPEPRMLALYEQLQQPSLPGGQELVDFLRYLAAQGMVETKQGKLGSPYEGLTIVTYSQVTELQNLWETYPVLRNFRGLVVDAKGNVVARPFKKTHKAGIELPLDALTMSAEKVFEKANGSMGICYFYNGDWHIATKFSFTNDSYTAPAKAMLDQLHTEELDPARTYLFEIILHDDPHIVEYGGQDKLILLNATETSSGTEVPWEAMRETARRLGAELVPDLTEQFAGMSIADIYRFAQTPGNLTNVEGLMALYTDPVTNEAVTVKVKSIEYDKKKFVRDHLDWEKLVDVYNHGTGDLPSEQKEALLAYNIDDAFVRSALIARVEWIQHAYNALVTTIQDAVAEPWVSAQEKYENEMAVHGDRNRALSTAMSLAAAVLNQRVEGKALKGARGALLGFVRSNIVEDQPSTAALDGYIKLQLKEQLQHEIARRGKASFWITPDDNY